MLQLIFLAAYNTSQFEVNSLHARAQKAKETLVDDGSGTVKVINIFFNKCVTDVVKFGKNVCI